MRAKIAVFMCLLFTLSLLPVALIAQEPTFRDVPVTHFAFEAINWVSDPANGALMVGDANRNFNPNRHINKFEAAQIYAAAAGFPRVMHLLPEAEREVFNRSFETHRAFLDSMAAQFSSWNRTFDREIAYLLYRGIITSADVQNFIVVENNIEQRPLLTRQQGVTWITRLIGQGAQARDLTMPPASPFRDDASINAAYRHYVYHARDLGIIRGADGNMNPTASFTRAEMAAVLHNALTLGETPVAATPAVPATVSGTVASVADGRITIATAVGSETFSIAPNAVIMIDNSQRTAQDLRQGMPITALINTQRQAISMVARTPAQTAQAQAAPTVPLHTDEGFVTAVNLNPRTITIRTRRVRIHGQIVDEERTFSFASNAVITMGGEPVEFSEIRVGDIAFFTYAGTVMHSVDFMERERTILGILTETRTDNNVTVFIIEQSDGRGYELRVLPSTSFSRTVGQQHNENLAWSEMRIGDAITADVEFDRLVSVHAVGERSSVSGRLTQMQITENNSQITVQDANGESLTYIIRPGVFDVYALRIGMQILLQLDSREVMSVQVQGGVTAQTAVLGFIQTINPNAASIVIVETRGNQTHTHTITLNQHTRITRGGAVIRPADLRVNMNVYIVLTAAQSGIADSVTVLP